ncbi:hypothetical protein EDD86DRAFT_247744 [Gorgonomyces haynaldii]|nr:hypothetical protein EDD86DRAFT_247744 [Gorgonomyces haynaldii]
MGHSIRSKSKRKYRAIRRENIHGPVEEERLHKIINKIVDKPKRFAFKSPFAVEQIETQPVEEDPKEAPIEEEKLKTETQMQVELSKKDKDKLFLSRNQYKKKYKLYGTKK